MKPTTPIETLDEDRLIASAEFLPALRAAGLDTFDKIMTHSGGQMQRAIPHRSTVRIEIGSMAAYLKRYEAGYLSAPGWLLRLLRWPSADDEAGREWRKILLLRQHGFLTAAPIALGQRRGCCGVVTESLLVTREIEGGKPADDVLKAASMQRRRRLLANIGELARRFHDAGFIHKDLYLKHIFAVETCGDDHLHLIDLQRVLGPRRHRTRWYRKDQAALAFSARAHAQLSATNLLRLYRSYSRVTKLTVGDKNYIRQLWPRVERLLQRTPKYKRIWNQ